MAMICSNLAFCIFCVANECDKLYFNRLSAVFSHKTLAKSEFFLLLLPMKRHDDTRSQLSAERNNRYGD